MKTITLEEIKNVELPCIDRVAEATGKDFVPDCFFQTGPYEVWAMRGSAMHPISTGLTLEAAKMTAIGWSLSHAEIRITK